MGGFPPNRLPSPCSNPAAHRLSTSLRNHLNFGLVGVVRKNIDRGDILNCLIGVLQILFKRDSVLDSEQNNGRGKHKGGAQSAPSRTEDGVVWLLEAIQSPENSIADGLNTFKLLVLVKG